MNIADLLSYWTGGLLKSTVHRVVFAGGSEENSCEERGQEKRTNESENNADSVRANGGEDTGHGNGNGHHQVGKGAGTVNGDRHGSGDRYSIAFFLHPNRDTPLVPIPSPLIQALGKGAGNGMGKVLTANEHLKSRLAATYGWRKEEAEARREADGDVQGV